MTVKCRWSLPCNGAIAVLRARGDADPRTRLAAADLAVPSRGTATLRIALTPVGRQLVGARSVLRGSVFISVKWAQGAPDETQAIVLHG